ncbi:hypothetical protein EC957_010272 [Mortierella hygrophila]|uniref:Uncharacterized protein n=1 Tax=Mortierella hygrophila TaxID=979708 RepID=A0A9P6K455_9FUNG|nr:hypothetical protein EC957_010272 [Mortierella hygrophila]
MSGSTIASTIAATVTSAVLAATDSIILPTPTASPFDPAPTFSPSIGGNNTDTTQPQLCDWIRTAARCRDADFTRTLLIASSVMHGLVFLFGLWLLAYRHRGINTKIVTELYVTVGTGVRPKPMDCITFFMALASFLKIGVNLCLILDAFPDKLWLRIIFEQTYWVFVAIGFSSYFVGLLYAMPVTTKEGIFAVYQPEVVFGEQPLSPIHVLTPTTVHKNVFLVMGAVYPTIFGAGVGVASALTSQMAGYEHVSRILLLVQYSNWVFMLWLMAIMFFYYGLKYTFILRANIILAEAALKAPRAAFGIGNLRSASPARFLFIQLQITGFGGSAVTLLAGTLCMIWVLYRDEILSMTDVIWPRTMAFFWTCAIAVAYFVIMALIAVQSVRNRRRGLHEPITSVTNSYMPGQKTSSSNNSKGLYSQPHKARSVQSESEARLAQRNSGDFSTLHSAYSVEKDVDGVTSLEYETVYEDARAIAAMVETPQPPSNQSEQDRANKKLSVGSPSRPFTIMTHRTGDTQNYGRRESDAQSSLSGHNGSSAKVAPDLRNTVFGAQPRRPSSPPPSASSYPLINIRSSSSTHKSKGNSSRSQGSSSHTTSQASSEASSATKRSLDIMKFSPHALTPLPDVPTYSHSYSQQQQQKQQQRQQQKQQQQQQPPYEQQEPYQTLQYKVSQKGLSPPPRAKRLANGPNPGFEPSSPSSPVSPPARDTFMMNGSTTTPEGYSDTPRIGGGVRRKSLKGIEEDETGGDPYWPLPPRLN